MDGSAQRYNRQALAACSGWYYGKEIPQSSNQPPAIIIEPLTKIYSKARHCRSDLAKNTCTPVKIAIYSSGIIIKNQTERHKVQWFPIQNLYCSAGLQPDSKKGNVVFRELHVPLKKASKPFFAMVVRLERKDQRRVLTCFAFMVDSTTVAQRLVQATEFAYKNKDGWNHPLTDKEFLNAKTAYTLERLDREEGNDELEEITTERERQLALTPDLSRAAAPRPVSARSARSHTAVPVRLQSARTPRSSSFSTPRSQAASNSRYLMVPPPASSRGVPTQQAITYYQGFKTETLHDDGRVHAVVKSASIGGFPLSRSSSNGTGAMSLQPTPQYSMMPNGRARVNGGQKAKRQVSDASSSKHSRGHRILASSEPEAEVTLNGHGNDSPGVEVVDWDEMVNGIHINGDASPEVTRKKGQSKHRRPTKKMMDKFLHNGDINGNVTDQSTDKVSIVLYETVCSRIQNISGVAQSWTEIIALQNPPEKVSQREL